VPAPTSDVPPHLASVWRQADELRTQGDLPGAIAALEPAAEVATMAYGSESPAALITLHRLAVLYRLQGDLAAARRVLDEAQAGGELRFGDDDPLMLQIAGELGAVAEELGNRHEARRNWSKVAEHGPDRLGPDHPQVRAALAYLHDDPAGPVYVPPERPALTQPALTESTQSNPVVSPVSPAPPPVPPMAPPPPVTPPEVGRGGHQAPGFPAPHVEPFAAQAPSPAPPSFPALPLAPLQQAAPPHSAPPHSAPPHSAPPLGAPASPVPVGHLHSAAQVEEGVWRVAQAPVSPAAGHGDAGEPRRRNGGLIVLSTILVVLLVAAIAVAVDLWRQRGTTPTASPSASVSAPASSNVTTLPTHKPPTDVKLRDNGDHATLTWTDPSGGTVPFLISGGRSGQEQHAYATVPAGTTTYPVNALNVNYDYCFVVIAVYSTTDLVTSDLVCTRRHVSPSATG
jgi:Tetratricopeptide repeat